MVAGDGAAGSMSQHPVVILHLYRRMRFAPALAYGFQQLRHPALVARMIAAKTAAIGVERQAADAGNQIAVRDELPALPFSQKPRSSSCTMTVIVKLSYREAYLISVADIPACWKAVLPD